MILFFTLHLPCIVVLDEDYSTSSDYRFSLSLPQMTNDAVTFTASIINDNDLEGDHFFTVSLIEVDTGDGYIIVTDSEDSRTSTITITDVNDGKTG